MSKFIMVVGLPGSGKSTLAKELSQIEKAMILSSDKIRMELNGDVNDQSDPQVIFEEMNNRANILLSEGRTVIYDATNLNRKRRRHIINFVIKADEKIVHYINQHISTIKDRNKNRSKSVEEYVVNRMYKTLHIPVKNEGWDEVIFTGTEESISKSHKPFYEELLLSLKGHDEFFEGLSQYLSDFKDIYNLPHDSTYHSFSVSRHIYYVYKYILENYHEDDKLLMLWAAIFHDVGKGFCKSFTNHKGEETKYANFIGHEFVSSQLAACYLTALGYEHQFVSDVANLVQFHMMPMNASEKKLNEIEQLLGDHLFRKLMFLHEADMQGK
ncbi:AAA family ATPase [Cytobacillus suaedae]|nr:AAA family ATPase [Cytobacillus suaedae]